MQLSADELQNSRTLHRRDRRRQRDILRDRRSGELDRVPGASVARAGHRRRTSSAGTAFLFDRYQNLVLQPQPVKFDLTVNGQTTSRTERPKDGVAFIKLDSSKKEGPAQFVASSGSASYPARGAAGRIRSLQHSHEAQRGQEWQFWSRPTPFTTAPAILCPDGTIVTFTSTDAKGKSTVDARIKRGIAQAELPASQWRHASRWPSGVVVGNEIHWRGGQ